MSTPRITVVIPTLRGRHWLPACLDALSTQTFRDFDTIVIDNASTDGTQAWLTGRRDVRVIRNAVNLGFAEACNQGIRASTAPFVALLNDDTQAQPHWLEALHAGMMADERIGSCASLMVYADRPDMVQSAGIGVDRAAIAWDRLAGLAARGPDAQRGCEVFGASAGAALYRRAMLDAIDLFDARFFAYLEDVDLAWRAQAAGWRCRYVPEALVRHHTSATSGAGSAFKQRLIGRNKLWLVAKNASGRDLPIIALFDVMAVAYAALSRGNLHHLRGRLDALAQWSKLRRDRSWQRTRIVFAPPVWPWRVAQRMAPR